MGLQPRKKAKAAHPGGLCRCPCFSGCHSERSIRPATLPRHRRKSRHDRAKSPLRLRRSLRLYRVAFSNGTTLLVTVYLEPDGKIEQLLVVGKD